MPYFLFAPADKNHNKIPDDLYNSKSELLLNQGEIKQLYLCSLKQWLNDLRNTEPETEFATIPNNAQ